MKSEAVIDHGPRRAGRIGAAGRWMRFVACALACGVALVAFAGCAQRDSPVTGPVAAVVDPKGTLVLVDLEHGSVVRRERLRSAVSDIAADVASGSFVTAQCGGVGDEADDAIGVVPVRAGGAVSYMRLPRPNPIGVESAGAGRVLVDHGWVGPDGVFACVVDVRSGEVIAEGSVPDNNTPMRVADGFAWSSGIRLSDDVPTLRRVDVHSLRSEAVGTGGPYASIECTMPGALAGWLLPRGAPPLLARFNDVTAAVEQTAAVSLDDGPGRLVHAGGFLVAVDGADGDLDAPGRRLLVFDAVTLRLVRAVRLAGAPSDVAAWGDRVVVTDWKTQRLHVIESSSGRLATTVSLPKMTPLPLRVAVLDQ